MPDKRESLPAGGATMQLDAIVDDLEEVDAPDVGPMVGAPPPLPPEKAGKGVWVIGVVVVLIAAALGLGVGVFLQTQGASAPADTAADAPATPPPAQGSVAEPEAPGAADPAAADPEAAPEDEGTVMTIDDVVFDEPTEGTELSGEPGEEEELPAE